MSRPSAPSAVCARIADRLAQSVGRQRYDMWFDRSARLNYDSRQRRLEIAVPNRFFADWIRRNFQAELCAAAHDELGCDVDLKVNIDPARFDEPQASRQEASRQEQPRLQPDAEGELARPKPQRPPQSEPREPGNRTLMLALRHRLEDFVVGAGNQLAHASALAIARDDAEPSAPNTLYVHGGVGLGKTHLLQGICHLAQRLHPRQRVLYTTGERFTNDYIAAVRANKIEDWRRQVRRLDLLAIDDVHFMANKQKTQQEFLHCLDDLEHAGRRIVLAGDSHPRQMKQFSEALVSRCLRGMVAELRTPDTDTRLRMVKALAQRRGIHLIDAVVQTLASRCQGSVRELEGTLTKLHALASLTPQLAAAADGDALLGQPQIGHALVHQLFSLERAACTRSAIPFERIFDTVCQKLDVKREDVMGRTRQRHVVLARSLVIHLTRELTSMSYPEIASRMGKGSHSTIVTSAGRLQDQLAMETPTLVAAGPGGDTLPLRELIDRLRYAIEHA